MTTHRTNPNSKNLDGKTHPSAGADVPSKALNISVVGATGIVGKEFLKILTERDFPVTGVKLFASRRSAGEKISFKEKTYVVQELTPGCFTGDHVAFFSAGADISKEWGPRAASEGAFVIDNSSAFRMDNNVPLVVPEVNAHTLPNLDAPSIIANPNCSTIQLVVALKPLHDALTLKSVTVSTYQSVSGAGKEGTDELLEQLALDLEEIKRAEGTSTEWKAPSHDKPGKVFSHNIAFNNIPQIDKFDPVTGFTLEELKVVNETRKIMALPNLNVSCTAVRTPTLNGHSEAVWIEVEKEASRDQVIESLKGAPGVVLVDDPSQNQFPLNRVASGTDPVFIGRIRRDLYNSKRWLFWVVSDNVRKGAALNGVQIAEKLFDL